MRQDLIKPLMIVVSALFLLQLVRCAVPDTSNALTTTAAPTANANANAAAVADLSTSRLDEVEENSWFPGGILSYLLGVPIHDPSEEHFGINDACFDSEDEDSIANVQPKGRFRLLFDKEKYGKIKTALLENENDRLTFADIEDMLELTDHGEERYRFVSWCLQNKKMKPNVQDETKSPLICRLAADHHGCNDIVKALLLHPKFKPLAVDSKKRDALKILKYNEFMRSKHKKVFKERLSSKDRSKAALDRIISDSNL